MNDLNFFASYHEKNKVKINKEIVIFVLTILLIIVMIFYSFLNHIKIKKLIIEAETLKQQVEISNLDKKVSEIIETESKIEELKGSFGKLKQLDKHLVENDIIDKYLLDEITSRVSESIFLNSMIFNSNLIQIEGISKDKKSIADFERNLKGLKHFDEVFIPEILYNNDYYKFIINIKSKDVE